MNFIELKGEKVGTVNVSLYRDTTTGLCYFYLQAENEDVLPLTDILEDTLYNY